MTYQPTSVLAKGVRMVKARPPAQGHEQAPAQAKPIDDPAAREVEHRVDDAPGEGDLADLAQAEAEIMADSWDRHGEVHAIHVVHEDAQKHHQNNEIAALGHGRFPSLRNPRLRERLVAPGADRVAIATRYVAILTSRQPGAAAPAWFPDPHEIGPAAWRPHDPVSDRVLLVVCLPVLRRDASRGLSRWSRPPVRSICGMLPRHSGCQR